MTDLFYDEDVQQEIKIRAKWDSSNIFISIKFREDRFTGCIASGEEIFTYGYKGEGRKKENKKEIFNPFKFYRFKIIYQFPSPSSGFLLPPHGENLFSILLTHKDVRQMIKNMLEEYGLKITLKMQEKKIEIQKEQDDIIISHPYSLLSDTFQRIIFHLVAIETNRDSVIIFEEPEAHAFPYHTKFLAERIALDKKGNQYFISTHNPYLLLSIIEKAPKEDVAIFITTFENYQTHVKKLSEEIKEEILEETLDVFFNIEQLVEKEK